MNLLRLIGLVVLTLGVAGCGNLQLVKVAQVPDTVTAAAIELSSTRPTKEEVAPRGFEIADRSLFLQQTSGGSAAIGVLFGPLGTMANVANIDRLTAEMGASGAKSSLFRIDAQSEARAAWADRLSQRRARSKGSVSVVLKPYILLYVFDEKIGTNTLVAVRAESNDRTADKAPSWVGNYYYYLDKSLPMAMLQNEMPPADLANYRSMISEAYNEILDELFLDFSSAPLPEREIAWVKSPVLGLGMPGDIGRSAKGHMTLRAMWGDGGRLYNTIVFTSPSQYTFDNGPVRREKK